MLEFSFEMNSGSTLLILLIANGWSNHLKLLYMAYQVVHYLHESEAPSEKWSVNSYDA